MIVVRNIAFQVAYDGTLLAGSQLQSHQRTVQGELEAVWYRLNREVVRVTLAGRTDAGVHALGQVGNVVSASERSMTTLLTALNANLPDDIAITQVWEPPRDFHARFWAERRTYEYVIDDQVVKSPLLRQRAWAMGRCLDVDAMHVAGQVLVGEHDFAAFTVGAPAGSTVRRCYAVTCERTIRFHQPVVVVRVTANGFLRNMMRIVAGTLLLVGQGRLSTEGVQAILNGLSRQHAGQLAVAHGLTLMAVEYPASALRPAPPLME